LRMGEATYWLWEHCRMLTTMTLRPVWIAMVALLSVGAWAQTSDPLALTPHQPKLPPGHERVAILWPEGAPGALGKADIDEPRLFVFPAKVAATERAAMQSPRTGVIVLPGGAYRTLMMEKEGATVARWLSQRGVDAFVLQYRLGPKYHFPTPMLDGARAVRYVRSHAAELGVAPNKVGVWGFSAGGHLAGWLATVHDNGNPKSQDPVERVSDRPDFAILSYARLSVDPSIPRPTNLEALVGDHPSEQTMEMISIDRHVTMGTSPSFIFSTSADETVNSRTATAYYDALKRLNIPAELHIFERGAHGVGLGLGLQHVPELSELTVLVENWMQTHGWMEDRPDHL
jgi:acetyl esterase/lipase